MSQTPVCAVDDIEHESAREFRQDGKMIIVAKQDDQIHAYLNWCPHLGIELNFMPDEFMDSDRQFLMCANHGALFDVASGQCVSGPCNGEHLVAVPSQVRDGQIYLSDVPDMPL